MDPMLTSTATRADSRAVFGTTMMLVAATCAFAAAGAYLGRDLSATTGLILFIVAIVCIIGLNVAAKRAPAIALVLLFALGLLLGLAVGPLLAEYASTQPDVLWQAAGATALTVAGLGAYGYATRRDLSNWGRTLFWLLLALIVFGIVLVFVNIPGGNQIYAFLGLALFSAYTIFDFNRLRRANRDDVIPIAAGIFLDVFNIFLFFLQIFGRR